VHHHHKRLSTLIKTVERPVFGRLVWDSLLLVIKFTSLPGTLTHLNTTIALLTIFSNGEGAANGNVPASGRLPLSTLDHCLANFAVDPSTGVLSQTDYFEPYEYQSLDGSDRDFGSSGSCLLDPTTFSGTGVDRMIVAGGKTGKVYVLNADNLGGFAQGLWLDHPYCCNILIRK
jgi:hypothetical protein